MAGYLGHLERMSAFFTDHWTEPLAEAMDKRGILDKLEALQKRSQEGGWKEQWVFILAVTPLAVLSFLPQILVLLLEVSVAVFLLYLTILGGLTFMGLK